MVNAKDFKETIEAVAHAKKEVYVETLKKELAGAMIDADIINLFTKVANHDADAIGELKNRLTEDA
ncbi:hypothetical protein H9655_21095 [Cytobacillus sp. Sa5YUA1]|uniref:Uncharacterized protein n=1 Tax=Cytobacillus stercorigallinarum TaxID=2762240 RepID=A0ABR8QVH5_9BACI|nr:hypothetical protein [Cytobacillus stercorigallinarum]MBD7939543.1 hypothetical protein [Cytobacillus stercorigallinarum]